MDEREIGKPAAMFRLIGAPLPCDFLLRITTPAAMRLLIDPASVQKQVI